MNGGIAFARTMRALDADGFRGSKLGLLLAAALLAAWSWWMLTPRVPQYEAVENVSLKWDQVSHQVAVTDFPPDALTHIYPGQPAQLYFDGRTISAQVVARVILQVPSKIDPPLPSRAKIEIETDRVTPASIVLRTLGRGNR